MSLYNMLFGKNRAAPAILATLGLTESDVPRFRDCFINGDEIVIHTRTGGGNREYYEEDNDALCAHPCYLRDDDDDFDSTYANFYFRFPEEYAADLKALAEHNDSHTPSEKWQALFAAMSANNTPQG